jgi:hypothetical protein
MFELLLKDGRANPIIYDNYILKKFIEHNQLNAVQLLLKDKRVDPSTSNNYALELALDNKYYDIVTELLKDIRVLRLLKSEMLIDAHVLKILQNMFNLINIYKISIVLKLL